MNIFTPHLPNFVDNSVPVKSYNFETTEDLLQLEIVVEHSKDDGFSHFALSDNYLMKILNDGFEWWVIGYIKNIESIDLPKWAGAKYRAKN